MVLSVCVAMHDAGIAFLVSMRADVRDAINTMRIGSTDASVTAADTVADLRGLDTHLRYTHTHRTMPCLSTQSKPYRYTAVCVYVCVCVCARVCVYTGRLYPAGLVQVS